MIREHGLPLLRSPVASFWRQICMSGKMMRLIRKGNRKKEKTWRKGYLLTRLRRTWGPMECSVLGDSVVSVLSLFLFCYVMWNSHITDKKTETQWVWVICPRSHVRELVIVGKLVHSWGFSLVFIMPVSQLSVRGVKWSYMLAVLLAIDNSHFSLSKPISILH